MAFRVLVADNFHYRDDSETYELGTYPSLEIAEGEAKRIVNECLASLHKPGISADDLYKMYSGFGDDPYIVGADDGAVHFRGWQYAREQCTVICPPAP